MRISKLALTTVWNHKNLDHSTPFKTASELFGPAIPGAAALAAQLGRAPDGPEVLATLDRPEQGGNGDGVLDAADAGFASLQLWRDANGNGATEAGELISLADAGLAAIAVPGAQPASPRAAIAGNPVLRLSTATTMAGQALDTAALDLLRSGDALATAVIGDIAYVKSGETGVATPTGDAGGVVDLAALAAAGHTTTVGIGGHGADSLYGGAGAELGQTQADGAISTLARALLLEMAARAASPS